jgi:predicted ATPase/DNA-binding SARP family transcriptional activator
MTTGAVASPRLEVRVLGPLQALRDGRVVDLGQPRQRALLAILLLSPNEVVSAERLIDELWGERPPSSAPNMIQIYVSRLRKALGPGLLLTVKPGYVLRVDEQSVDATRFAELVERAGHLISDGAASAAKEMLEEALGMWRGPPLAEFTYESFMQGALARFENARLEAIELRIDADLALGRHVPLVGELEQRIADHPFRERLRGQLMLALYRSGRQAEALEAYRTARTTLLQELGIEPSPAVRELEQKILDQDIELLASSGTSASLDYGLGGAQRRVNLPPELTSLIGRDSDVERIAALVAQHLLTTVVGPGGVGKTRVAQRVARTVADRFDHGVWFVDLQALDRGGGVSCAVLSAVGISDRPRVAALDTIAAELRTRRMLLLLDNCEHVVGGAAEVGERLLRECPGVRILATSRGPLAIAGERVQRLEPLPTTSTGSEPPAAVALFLDRTTTHGVSWQEDAETLQAIQELCLRLDGMPLAIELAAARTRAISPAGLLAHLGDRMRLLAGRGQRSAPTRQQTLEAAIAWSYDLLALEEQATLRRLSVFHGGFSLAAAAAVCAGIGSDLDTLDRITALADQSVVTVERRPDGERYRLLESIGLFAEERLREAGEEREARDRHARFFLALAQAACESGGSRARTVSAARLAVEQDNLSDALSWSLDGGGDPIVGAELAAAIGMDWALRGRTNVARRWLERALELGQQVTAPTRVAVHVARAVLAASTEDLETALANASEATRVARETEDLELVAEAVAQLAFTHQALDHRDEASAAAAELRSILPRLSSPTARVMALLACAHVALAAGRSDPALADAATAQQIARSADDHIGAAMSGFLLAYGLAVDSQIPAARAAIGDASHDAVRSGYDVVLADNLLAASSLALADGDLEAAVELLPRVVAMLREQQRWEDLGRRLHVAAAVELRRGFSERSAVLLGAALRRVDRMEFFDELVLPELAHLNERLSAQLGGDSAERAFRRGAGLSLDDIAALLGSAAASPHTS